MYFKSAFLFPCEAVNDSCLFSKDANTTLSIIEYVVTMKETKHDIKKEKSINNTKIYIAVIFFLILLNNQFPHSKY